MRRIFQSLSRPAKITLTVLGIPGILLLGSNVLLNVSPDPPAVAEARKRRRLYEQGAITKAEYQDPRLFQRRQLRDLEENSQKAIEAFEKLKEIDRQAERWDELRESATEEERRRMDWEIEGYRGRGMAENFKDEIARQEKKEERC